MRVWLVTVGEPLPIDGKGERLHRAGILADYLRRAGHEVVWWSSSFDHVRKRHRVDRYTAVTLENGVDLRLLHGCGYRRNISFDRIRDHRQIARQFAELAPLEPKPDVMVTSFPTIELSVEAVRYGRRFDVPVVVDIRDLWPEIFLEVAPFWARPVANLLLQPLWRATREALSGADALTGNSPGFVAWGLRQANRPASMLDRHFPFGYVSEPLSAAEEAAAFAFWRAKGVSEADETSVVCFFGAFSGQFDMDTVVDAARVLMRAGRNFQFVLCGSGERLEALRKRAGDLPNVIFPGWVGRAEIWALMKLSKFGLAPYKNHIGFTGNFPNKPIEYFSGGLPVISCLDGYLRDFLATNRCGLYYRPGDAEDLCAVLERAALSQSSWIEMSANAKKCFSEQFEANKVYGEMIAYLAEVSIKIDPVFKRPV